MIEKPELDEEKIIMALNQNYLIQVKTLEFLPVGNDASAFSYRVETRNENVYFLKIKKNFSNFAVLYIPQFLKDAGIEQVITPLRTKTKKLMAEMDGLGLILYPFITGKEAIEVGMSDSQWTEFGSVLKRIHLTELPSDISQYVRQETFIPKWSSLAKLLHEQINTRNYDDPDQKQLALFWKKHSEIIQILIGRAEMIGKRLQQTDLEFILCHADIHAANILLTQEQNMFIVDWDEVLLAPKERDLMFVLGEETIRTREEQLFFDGYGEVEINQLALAYYRYEWCVQEIGDYGNRVFLTKDIGESTKQGSVAEFMKLFSQGDVIETALDTPVEI